MVWRWTHSPTLCACLFYVFYNVGYKEIINGACCQRRKYHHGHVTMYYDVPCMKLRAQMMEQECLLLHGWLIPCFPDFTALTRALKNFPLTWLKIQVMKPVKPPWSRLHPFTSVCFFFVKMASVVFKFWKIHPLHRFSNLNISLCLFSDRQSGQTDKQPKIWTAAIQAAETDCSVFYTHWKQ